MKIRLETPPTRCEICHQADQFNAASNSCARCISVLPERVLQEKDELQLSPRLLFIKQIIALALFIVPITLYLCDYHFNLGILFGLTSLFFGTMTGISHTSCLQLCQRLLKPKPKTHQQIEQDHNS